MNTLPDIPLTKLDDLIFEDEIWTEFIKLINLNSESGSKSLNETIAQKYWFTLSENFYIEDCLRELNEDKQKELIWIYCSYLENWIDIALTKISDIDKLQKFKDKSQELIKWHMTRIFLSINCNDNTFPSEESLVEATKLSIVAIFNNLFIKK